MRNHAYSENGINSWVNFISVDVEDLGNIMKIFHKNPKLNV